MLALLSAGKITVRFWLNVPIVPSSFWMAMKL